MVGLLLFASLSLGWTADAETPATPPVVTAIPVASAVSSANAPVPDEPPGPQRLKETLRVAVETNAPSAGTGTTNVDRQVRFRADWQGWNGLWLELHKTTRLPQPLSILPIHFGDTNFALPLRLERVEMTARLGGRVAVDAAGYVTSGNLSGFDPGAQLRRARLSVAGDCILLLPLSYAVQVAYTPSEFSLEESYLQFRDLPFVGSVKLGQFQAPMGLDVITSSRDILFMEPAAPLQALAPGNLAGVQIGSPIFDQRMTWALGLFAQGTGTEYGVASQDFGSVIGRVTWLPLWDMPAGTANRPRFLHLGLSANSLYSSTSTIRYRSRPESYQAPYVIDTSDLDASSAVTVGGEAAWVNGPLSLQGEWLYTSVRTPGDASLDFNGGYVLGSWFLTGESRPYDPRQGKFTRLIPRRNFHFHSGGGAWEVQARFSHTDLTDGPVPGGQLHLLMTGVNWYLQPHLKLMFNYGFGRVSQTAQTGNLNIFQMRLEVDF
jgi:phosphate-selective porin OprO/OprP